MSRVALVVGGGTGIGYASAERLARRGVAVMLSGRREGKLKQAQEKLTAEVEGVQVAYSAGDSSVEADAKRIVADTVEALGGLDFCVNCAGTYEPTDFLAMDEKSWRQTIAPTLDAMVYPCVAAAKVMAESGGGRFVLISSINSPVSEPEAAHYSAAKAGVASLARSMAVDLAKHNILVNAVAPGWVATDMVGDFVENASPESLKQLNILARVGEADELGNVIEYLILDAPEYLDGATIFVDGGQTAMAPLI
ncbi:MAG TPA: SDR family oxidoreductase [Solirubrobacterales bacterium]|jgi:NAD(P)-dependent dehydrogenase (short-subunit alcohol dehydrogenase family)